MAALPGCRREESRPTLTASIEPLRFIVEQIAGDNFEVTSLMGNGANPETFEPSMSKRMALDRSQAFFISGYLPFEMSLNGSLPGSVTTVDTSEGLELIYGTHNHGHDDSGGDAGSLPDPHTWMSLRNAKVIAANVAHALCEIDPAHSDDYEARLHTLVTRIDNADAAIAAKLRTMPRRSFAVWHPSLSYIARDYGLEQISVGSETKEASVSRLRHIIDEAVADSVDVFFFQREFDSRQAESISRRIGSRMVTIDPQAYDIINEITKITDELAR